MIMKKLNAKLACNRRCSCPREGCPCIFRVRKRGPCAATCATRVPAPPEQHEPVSVAGKAIRGKNRRVAEKKMNANSAACCFGIKHFVG